MSGQPRSQTPESTINLADYLAVFRRRKAVVLVAAGVLICLSLAAAVLWPPTFKSTATILSLIHI